MIRFVKEIELILLEEIVYGLYLYFLGLSLRNVVKALSFLRAIKRSHVFLYIRMELDLEIQYSMDVFKKKSSQGIHS